MANSDKNIVITPSIGNTAEPRIVFTGANVNPTTLRTLDDGTLSFEGGTGQLFSISNTITGNVIFSVNDVTGFPVIETYANAQVQINRLGGKVSIGTNTTPAVAALSVQSNTTVTGIDILGGPQTAGGIRFQNSSKLSPVSTKELVFLDTKEIRFTDGNTWLYDDWGAIAYSTGNSSFWIGKGGTGSGPIGANANTVANVNFVGISAFTIANSSVNKLTLAANGNLGIGNTTPADKFVLVGGMLYTGTARAQQATLTDGATISWDTSSAQVATVTLAGNRTVAAPTNLLNGAFYALEVIQDATGSRTLAWNAVFKWTGGAAPILSTAANARDYFVFRSNGTNLYEQGRSLGVA